MKQYTLTISNYNGTRKMTSYDFDDIGGRFFDMVCEVACPGTLVEVTDDDGNILRHFKA